MGVFPTRQQRWIKSVVGAVWIGAAIALLLSACGAHSPNILAERYKSIHIPVFKNRTLDFALEEQLTADMIKAFERDGRLRVVPKSAGADLQMNTRITDVELIPIAYSDLDRAIGYNMTLVIEVDVVDAASGEAVVKNRRFTAAGSYLLNSNPATTSTRNVSHKLSGQVISYLIEGW